MREHINHTPKFEELNNYHQFSSITTILDHNRPIGPVTWQHIRHYCSGPAGWLTDDDSWDEKREPILITKLIGRLNRETTMDYSGQFAKFLTWVATESTVTENTKSVVLGVLAREQFVRFKLHNIVMSALKGLVEKDWARRDTSLPSFAAPMLHAYATNWINQNKNPIDPVVQKSRDLFPEATFFNTTKGVYALAEVLLNKHLPFTRYEPTIRPFVRLYALRRLLDAKAAGMFPDLKIAGEQITGEIDMMLHKFGRGEREAENPLRGTIGVELQYEGKQRLGYARPYGNGTTSITYAMMKDLRKFARFSDSADSYYEFPMPPTYTASMQSLMFTELERIQHHLVGKVTPFELTAQPNLGDILYHSLKYPEAENLQLVLLCAGYGFRRNEFSDREDRVTWGYFNGINSGGKAHMVYQRSRGASEVEKVGGEARTVTELRMPVIFTFSEGVRLFQYVSDFTLLMKASQKQTKGESLSKAERQLAALWDTFYERTEHIYKDFGIEFSELVRNPQLRNILGARVKAELQKIHREESLEGEPSLALALRQLIAETRSTALAIEQEALRPKKSVLKKALNLLGGVA